MSTHVSCSVLYSLEIEEWYIAFGGDDFAKLSPDFPIMIITGRPGRDWGKMGKGKGYIFSARLVQDG